MNWLAAASVTEVSKNVRRELAGGIMGENNRD
jgi:hypothetical protein